MRVYLLGYFHAGAFADDLIELVTADLLRTVMPDCRILDAATNPHPRSGPEVAEFFNREADLVLFCGGSLLGRLRLSPFHSAETWIARLKVPLVIFGTGWRTERRPLSDAELDRMKLLLAGATAIYVRGEATAARLRQLTDKIVLPIGDPGLCFTPSSSIPRHPVTPSSRRRVGVAARDMPPAEIAQDGATIPNERFHARLAKLLDSLELGARPEVIFCPMTAIGRPIDSDFAGCEAVARRMRRQSWVCGEYFTQPEHTPRSVAEALGRCDLVISQRLHGTLVSIAQGVPVMPIEYQFGKMADALSVPGFERLRQLITPAAIFGIDAWRQKRDQFLDPDLVAASTAAAATVRGRYLAAVEKMRG